MIDGIVYGEDPRQGFAENNVFYHPDMQFRFNFPGGWALENQPAQVRMVPPDGKALMIFTLAQGSTLEEAAQTTIDQLGLTLQESKRATVNGFPAIAAVSTQVSQDQSTGAEMAIRVLSYFINYNNNFFVFHGLSTDTDFNSYFRLLESSMISFARLTDASKLNAKPKKILVRKVQRTGTLANAFAYYGMPQAMMEELALLNNLELNTQVPAGKLIKIVGE